MTVSSMSNKVTLRQDQRGLVSLIITMIMMIVLALILLGFSQLARREQRQALDRQLSTQAQYAAESGINIARRYLAKNPGYTKTGCAEDSAGLTDYQSLDGASGNVKITCLLISDDNPTVEVGTVVENKSTVVPILPSSSLSGGSLTVKWKDANKTAPSTTVNGTAGLPTRAVWADSIGILRIDLVPTSSATATDLQSTVFTAFLRPGASAAVPPSISATPGNSGTLKVGSCTAGLCSVVIDSLPSSSSYALRATAIYNPVSVDITGVNGAGTAVNFHGIPQIDVTARASDVLRRIRARVPSGGLTNNGDVFPTFALDSAGGICKQISVSPTTATDGCDSITITPGPGGGAPTPVSPPGSPPAPSPGDDTGAADFINDCGDAVCDNNNNNHYGSPANPQRWQTFFQNTSPVAASRVQSCTWDFGDGTSNGDNCVPFGTKFPHQFPVTPGECHTYPVNLKMYLTDNATYTKPTVYFTVPDNGRGEFNGPC